MDFVAIDTGIAGDRVTIDLARSFKLKRPHAAGLLTLTFAGMAKHAQDGSLAEVLDEQIEEWAYWHGTPGAFAAFVRHNLCDDNELVVAWEQWNGKMISRAKAERERLREYREQKRKERSRVPVREPDANGTGNPVPDLTRPNLTEPYTESIPTTRRKKRGEPSKGGDVVVTWITPFEAEWKRLGGPTSWDLGPALREFATIRKHYDEAEILRRMRWYFENRGSEVVLSPDRLATLRFIPTARDFRLRFDKFDPSADAVPVRS